MLLSLGSIATSPAHILEASCALHLGAPRLYKGDRNAAFGVRTTLGAVLDIQLVEYVLGPLVLLKNVLDVLIV